MTPEPETSTPLVAPWITPPMRLPELPTETEPVPAEAWTPSAPVPVIDLVGSVIRTLPVPVTVARTPTAPLTVSPISTSTLPEAPVEEAWIP